MCIFLLFQDVHVCSNINVSGVITQVDVDLHETSHTRVSHLGAPRLEAASQVSQSGTAEFLFRSTSCM